MIELDLQQLRVLFLALLILMLVTLAILVVYLVLAGRRVRRSMWRDQAQEGFDTGEGRASSPPVGQARGQVVLLLREEPGRALQVEVGGARYRRLTEIEDPHLKRQVVEAAMDLVRFTGALGADPIAPAPVDKTYSWREDLREELRAQGRQTPLRPASEDVEAQFLNLLSEMGPAPAAEKPTLAAAVKQRWSSKPTRQEESHSVVDEIEAIVQRRLLLIPALTGRDLHVRRSPEGTVLFLFEGHDYERLDDVPNMTAQQLVKDAIKEWDETT